MRPVARDHFTARERERLEDVVVIDGVPYADPAYTLALLPVAAIGEWLAIHRGIIRGRLLDVGAGNRPYERWYGPLVEEAVAVDVAVSDGLAVRAVAEQLPFVAGSFDTVLATEVLEHVHDAEAALAEVYRVLRPGGHALLTVPFVYPVHEAPYDFHRFTHYGLRDGLERHGLRVIDLTAKGGVGLLAAHIILGGLPRATDVLWRRVRPNGRRASEHGIVRWPIVTAQQVIVRIRRRHRREGVTRSASLVSLGYMAVARRDGA